MKQWNISINFQNFTSFLKWMCPQKCFLNRLLTLAIHKRVLVHNLTQRTVKFLQNLLYPWNPWNLLSRPQLVRNHFLVSLPKNQEMIWCNLFVFSDEVWNVRTRTTTFQLICLRTVNLYIWTVYFKMIAERETTLSWFNFCKEIEMRTLG